MALFSCKSYSYYTRETRYVYDVSHFATKCTLLQTLIRKNCQKLFRFSFYDASKKKKKKLLQTFTVCKLFCVHNMQISYRQLFCLPKIIFSRRSIHLKFFFWFVDMQNLEHSIHKFCVWI